MRISILLILALLLALPLPATARVFTLWPLIDYRSSPDLDYASLHLLGPLIKYERKGTEREVALRPFYFRAWDTEEEVGYREFLYPVGTGKSSAGATSWQSLHLLRYDFGDRELGSENEFMLFPFLFYGEPKEDESYFAFFPFGGRINDKFGRDEIRFTLFPLYAQTERKGTTTTNLVWPIFARVSGEGEDGVKFWPLFGFSEKEGVYRKRFFLWPIFFDDDLDLDKEAPRRRRAAFPFYLSLTSPERVSRSILWPFFHYRHDLQKDVEEWDMPWPLVRISRGAGREGRRFLPFYADESSNGFRKRSFLWPLYRIEELHTEAIDRRRDRILFFLFSHLEEKRSNVSPAEITRVDLWPLFSFQEKDGVGHLHALSLFEPFFPENRGMQRSWAPLWRFYQAKWDDRGNSISSFLWNLYWREKRGNELALELFPIFSYRREEASGTDFRLLKGLFRYSVGAEGHRVRILFLPWGVGWGGSQDDQGEEG